MSVKSWSSLGASHPSNLSTLTCTNSTAGFLIFSAFAATNILVLLPVSTLVLYVGFQRWRRQQATSTTTASSHADLFTYHIVAMEIFSHMASVFFCCGNYMSNLPLMTFGFYAFSIILPGQNLFQCLTCMERYLAVVHPITYLGLRREGGARIRNINIGCVWLICVGWMGVTHAYFPQIPVVPLFSILVFSLFVSSFCCLSVLRALTRPSPGERGGDRERVDQSKQRVFYTITAITGALLLRFAALLVSIVLYKLIMTEGGDACVVLSSAFWFCLPSSMVLPLLFLHRRGTLACCRHNTE